MTKSGALAVLKWIMSIGGSLCLCASVLFAQAPETFDRRIQQIMNRPEFTHSQFGIEF